MMEMTIKVEAPSLVAALEKLAVAITPQDPSTTKPDEPRPVTPVAPVAPPPTSADVPGPVPVALTAAAGQTAPPTEAPATAPAPAVPVTAPTYTLDQIAKAGASLVDAGKMEQLLELLGKYGVAAVTQLSPEQCGNFATELRALGAQI